MFVLALIPLSLILRKAKAVCEFSESKEKINHLLFLDDMSSVKWSDPRHFLKSQGNFFLSFPCTLFLHIFDI